MTVKYTGATLESTAKVAGQYAHAEGRDCTASGTAAHAEGMQGTASGFYSHAEGYISTASGHYSHAGGYGGRADAYSAIARGTYGSALGALRAQVAIYTCGAVTATTSPTTLTFDCAASINATPGATCNVLFLPTFSAYLFELKLLARRAGAVGAQGWIYSGMTSRESGSGSIVGTATQMAAWGSATYGTVAFAVNASNYLEIQVTPAATNSTVWHGVLIVNELGLSS